MLYATVRYFYPELKQEEIKKFSLLALVFFCSIGAYWLLRLIKDTIFLKIAFPEALGWISGQGRLFQPTAKLWSPLVVFVMVLVYSKLVDLFKKHTLFYIIYGFYAILFALFSVMLVMRNVYGVEALGAYPLALLGWVSYFMIESFGSLNAALFWSFVNSICTTEQAKRGYALIIAGAQVGAIGGSALMFSAGKVGIWALLMSAAVFTALGIPLIYYFMKVMPPSELVGNVQAAKTENKTEGLAGFTEGIRLLFSRSYLMGIFIVSTFYEVISQIIEYQMKSQADVSPIFAGEIGFAHFQGIYGVATNSLSLVLALLGTNYLIKRFGLRFGLLIYPVVLVLAFSGLFVLFKYGAPTATVLLWATFVVMMLAKGLGYAVNNPVKEMMYIPTSKDVRYKTKGFTDMFGGRIAKMGGSRITDAFKTNLSNLMIYGTFFSLGLAGIWILAAIFVGKRNEQLRKEGKIVE